MIPFDEKNYQNFMETEMPVWLRDTVESGKLITWGLKKLPVLKKLL